MDHFFFQLAEKAKFLRRRDPMSEFVERFLKKGAAADLGDLGVEVDGPAAISPLAYACSNNCILIMF